MIHLGGRALLGLDEFMLRFGHLRVICFLASEGRLTLARLEKKVSESLTKLIEVPEEKEAEVANYLKVKSLCLIDGKQNKGVRKKSYRYSDLILRERGDHSYSICHMKAEIRPKVWWQDLCLSSNKMVSGVGSVTADLKTHTGLSHVIDWAHNLGLLNKAGRITPFGQLVVNINKKINFDTVNENPYESKSDNLIIGYLFLGLDLDVFSRLAPKIIEENEVIKRQKAQAIFRSTIQDITREAKESKYLGTKQKTNSMKLYKDLKRTSKRKGFELDESSTAWHRTSSRFESYVELGLLGNDPKDRLSFSYFPTDNMRNAVYFLSKDVKSPRDWIEKYLTEIIIGTKIAEEDINYDDFLEFLPKVLSLLNRPTESLPINAICLGMIQLMFNKGRIIKMTAVRNCIESFAVEYPNSARLMRGRIGNRAEFISFNSREIFK